MMYPAWMRKGVAAVAAAAAVSAVAFVASPSVEARNGNSKAPVDVSMSNAKALYVVQMLDQPVVAYDGSIKGYPATRPNRGDKIDPNSAKVRKYAAYLDASHADVLSKVGGKKIYDYRYSFNGFAAEISEADAVKLRGMSNVLSVTKNELLSLDTADTPEFLGLSATGGLWEQLGGPETGKKQGGAGEGVIIGVIDSGIWPESPSFSDRDENGKLAYQQISGWHGKCMPGEAFDASMCNQKLIGARYFNAGYGGNAGVDESFADAYEFNSPRDADGHGTHTASTAGGNYGVDTGVSVAGVELGAISGMAPRARIAAYKACWGIDPDGGCPTVDTVAAIDQAVADGVDVINYSISGSQNDYLNPVEVAFLYAADAGIFVATSAGNDGPGAETLNHPSPWLTTVAASTHNRVSLGSGLLGDGTTLKGASVADTAVSAGLVASTAVGRDGADADEVALCYPGTLDPALVEGKIVACDRGVIARVDKSLAVEEAGGVGMFLMNLTSTETLNADNHSVPTLHVDDVTRATILDYITAAGAAATATINAAEVRFNGEPEMAAFSSRGPVFGGVEDVLKPDITAPGVDVLASVSPYSHEGQFDFLSGTSMSSPHMAGIGALMVDAHPDWSPMMIKSALMTSAHQEVTDGGAAADAFDFGAGHVQPNSAVDPGLVYDAGWTEWLGFLCGTGQLQAAYCPSIEIDPSDLNQASIAIGSLAGSQTVTRTVTNVGAAAEYTVEIDTPAGLTVEVTPSTISLGAGQSATYEVTVTTLDGATIDEYAEGAITWTDGAHAVRSPIVARPVALAAPAEVTSAGEPISYEVGFGTSGAFSADPAGLVPAQEVEDNVVDDPANDINTALDTGVGITVHPVAIPAGSTMARFSLFDDETDGNDDLDLYVFDAAGAFVAGSGSGTSAEQVDVELGGPTADVTGFFVVVHGWQTDGPDANYTLFAWGLPADSAGNMTVTHPDTAVLGETGTVGVEIAPLEGDSKYIGAVNYAVDGSSVGRTIVRVDID
jgi:hypothetical protein